jgi:putative peptidoglycan lipid II flippase
VEAAIMARSVSLAGFSIWPTGVRSHPVSRTVRREYLYLAATAAVGGGTLFIGQFMASTLSSGSVSVLNYGTRLASALLALGPAALSVAILPRFSLLAAACDWPALRRSLIGVLSLSLGIGALVSITLFYSSSLIVRLTLQRGAFTAADTAAVAAVQAISILQLPFTAGIAILLRTLSAMKANGIVLPVFGAALVVNIALGYLLMLRYQVAGIASAAVIGQIALLLALLALVFREGRRRFLTVRCP